MADITVDRAYREDGGIAIVGSNFTATTTTVEIDGTEYSFSLISPTKIMIEDIAGASNVTVTKGEVSLSAWVEGEQPDNSAPEEPYKTKTQNFTPGDITEEQSEQTSDVNQTDLANAASSGPGPDDPSEPAHTEGFATVLNINPRTPYPTGNPAAPAGKVAK